MYGPPLEAFHSGATCVTTPVTGHEEYISHGFNGVVVDWDDEKGMGRSLDLLARNRRYLHFLRSNALFTARGWPSWEQSGELMAAVLRRVHRDPPPNPDRALDLLTKTTAAKETGLDPSIETRKILSLLVRTIADDTNRAFRHHKRDLLTDLLSSGDKYWQTQVRIGRRRLKPILLLRRFAGLRFVKPLALPVYLAARKLRHSL
jgi:hypothetical protein